MPDIVFWEWSGKALGTWMCECSIRLCHVSWCYSHFTNKRLFYFPMRHCLAYRWIWECAGRCEPTVSIQSLMSPSSSVTQQSISINNQKLLPQRETLAATCDAFFLPQLLKVCGYVLLLLARNAARMQAVGSRKLLAEPLTPPIISEDFAFHFIGRKTAK